MSSKTTNSPSKPRGRRKNATILPVMLASAALFTSMAGFLGLQVAQGNDPMLGSAATGAQATTSAGGASRSANSQPATSNPTPVQTSTSG